MNSGADISASVPAATSTGDSTRRPSWWTRGDCVGEAMCFARHCLHGKQPNSHGRQVDEASSDRLYSSNSDCHRVRHVIARMCWKKYRRSGIRRCSPTRKRTRCAVKIEYQSQERHRMVAFRGQVSGQQDVMQRRGVNEWDPSCASCEAMARPACGRAPASPLGAVVD